MIRYYPELVQGCDEWHAARCGLLTASEMKLIITPTLKAASNDKERAHLYELLAQRITQYVEPTYVGDEMLRGHEDEVEARILYGKRHHPVTDMGFITNDKWGFVIGYSPDGLVGDDGQIECKSRRQKFHVETMVEAVPKHAVPADFMLQVQTGLLVSERVWADFICYTGGLPMIVVRAYPDAEVHQAIIEAATAFENRLADKLEKYRATLAENAFIPTERRVYEEIVI